MSAEHEMGGTDATTQEAAALLSILFAERTGDAIRALRAYADARASFAGPDLVGLIQEARGFVHAYVRGKAWVPGTARPLLDKIDAALERAAAGGERGQEKEPPNV